MGPGGEPGGGYAPELNRSGDLVWFQSSANLVTAPMNEAVAVYVRNLTTHTTCRIDLPGAGSGSYEALEAISPNGRYAIVFGGAGQYVVDEVTGATTAIPYLVFYLCCGSAHHFSYGIENDGRTIVAGQAAGEIYDAVTGELTQLKCPNGQEPNPNATDYVDLENTRYAGVVGDGCGVEAGYTMNLATNTLMETAKYDCEGKLVFPCIFELIPSEEGSHVLSSSAVGLRYDGKKIGDYPYLCGLTQNGEHAVFDGTGVEEYDARTATLQPVPGIGSEAGCWKQAVSSSGEIVYSIEGHVRLGHTG